MKPEFDFRPPSPRVPRHSVTFYASDAFPASSIAETFAEGLLLGESAFLAVTKEHRNAVLSHLQSFNFDTPALQQGGQLVCVEPEDALRELCRGGSIKHTNVEDFFAAPLEKLINASSTKSARVMGEVVSLLVEDGKPDEALELEQCWNRMASSYPLHVVCAYRESAFAKKSVLDQFSALCNEHDAVVPNLTPSNAVEKTPEWFTLLQVQTSSLRSEVFKRHRVERQMRNRESERLQVLESCLREYKPDVAATDFQEILNIVYEMCWDAYDERLELSPESPEWHKVTGEILSYSRMVVRLDIWNKHHKRY
jgi:DcmR-like sensory protein